MKWWNKNKSNINVNFIPYDMYYYKLWYDDDGISMMIIMKIILVKVLQ